MACINDYRVPPTAYRPNAPYSKPSYTTSPTRRIVYAWVHSVKFDIITNDDVIALCTPAVISKTEV